MKKNASKFLIIILFLGGLSLLLYPFAANQWNNYRQKKLMGNYDDIIAAKEADGQIDYETEWKAAAAYNASLLPSILPDSFSDAQKSAGNEDYMSVLNVTGNGMMGTVEIPKIKINIPVFHTVNEDVLEQAAGHLEGSSLPVGGESTHAVISAHRGLPSAALFTDLDKVGKGDHFLLHILDDTLCYEVDKITIVEPEQTQDLAVESGKDLVTLLTCTPYGVNSHRMLVRGHRVPYDPKALEDENVPLSDMSLHTSYLLWVIVGGLITAVFIILLYRREKKMAQIGAKEQSNDRVLESKKE
ncbi:MAG: class C sortase [Dorea sp.]|jgi:sortase A|nr:class C sortase [Dorea sp.]